MENTPKRGRGRPPKPDKLTRAAYMKEYRAIYSDRVTVEAQRGARDRWRTAANAAGARSLNAWIIETLDKAAAAQAINAAENEK